MGRKQWPLEIYGMETILGEGIKVEDLDVKELLILVLIELKIANKHLMSITDEEFDEEGGVDNDY